MTTWVRFDDVLPRLQEVLRAQASALSPLHKLWIVRDLWGRVRIVVAEQPADGSELAIALRLLAERVHGALGAHSYPAERAVLVAGDMAEAATDTDGARRLDVPGLDVFLLDRQVTGQSWSTVVASETDVPAPLRVTLYSIKGGVGRTTTATVLGTHLARLGKRVLLIDLDLEAPGLSTALLGGDDQPELGIVDWFVEDAVGQGGQVIPSMVARSSVARDLAGELLVAPAHGREPGEYLAKLGRVYLDGPPAEGRSRADSWPARLLRLLRALENHHAPDIVLLDSRSGLHDLAAALVTDIRAFVLLFGSGSEQPFSAYRMLFRHWLDHGTAELMRGRVKMVAAMIPDHEPDEHIDRFREASWDLFRDHLYDQVDGSEESEPFSFDLNDSSGPHDPLPIYWNRGLAALPSLRTIEGPAIRAAYEPFLAGVDSLLDSLRASEEP